MAKRRFEITVTGTAVLELDEKVIKAVDDDWRATFYSLKTVDDIARHIAYNLIVNNTDLSQLDGFADQPNGRAKVIDLEWDTEVAW